MAKRTHQFIGPTPVSDRRMNITPAQRARQHIRDNPCRWHEKCKEPRFPGLPLCFAHAIQIRDHMIDLEDEMKESHRLAARRNREFLEAERREVAERELRESKGAEPGWIYYLHVGEYIKIGYSTDVKRRIRAYPPGSQLLAVHPGTPVLEKALHEDYKGLLAQGREWFRPGPELLEHCESVVSQFGDPAKFAYKPRESNTEKQYTAPRGWSGRKPA